MNRVSASTVGSVVSAVRATIANTASLSTVPPAAWPRIRTSATEKMIENRTVNTAPAVFEARRRSSG
jgi:hypothetical protein